MANAACPRAHMHDEDIHSISEIHHPLVNADLPVLVKASHAMKAHDERVRQLALTVYLCLW